MTAQHNKLAIHENMNAYSNVAGNKNLMISNNASLLQSRL